MKGRREFLLILLYDKTKGRCILKPEPSNEYVEDGMLAFTLEGRGKNDNIPASGKCNDFITNINGAAIQHLQPARLNHSGGYLPFGETFVDQRHDSPYNTPYRFSGKEKDDETQYSYFGARYYDSDLSVWLSVDPLANKYPSMSPYMYCAGNPVMLVDPFGMDIINAYEKENKEAETKRNKAKETFDSFNGNKKADGYKDAKSNYNKANRQYQRINKKYAKVQTAIKDLETYNPDLYSILNNLQDHIGNKVDVYVEVTINLIDKGQSLMGVTNFNYDGKNHVSKYGVNTVSVELDYNLIDGGMTLSHEGGHVKANVTKFLEIVAWRKDHSNEPYNSHGIGNPSGIEAYIQEKIYINNKKRHER